MTLIVCDGLGEGRNKWKTWVRKLIGKNPVVRLGKI
jgi:hypothetical protein